MFEMLHCGTRLHWYEHVMRIRHTRICLSFMAWLVLGGIWPSYFILAHLRRICYLRMLLSINSRILVLSISFNIFGNNIFIKLVSIVVEVLVFVVFFAIIWFICLLDFLIEDL